MVATPIPAATHRRRLAPLLRRTWYSVNQTFRRRIAHAGLTPDQFSVLRWIGEGHRRGTTAKELCELMTSDPNTMAALIRRMQGMGLVTRQGHETDGRAQRIRATAKGRRAFAGVQHVALALQEEILSVLPTGERHEFLDKLEQLAHKSRTLLDASLKGS